MSITPIFVSNRSIQSAGLLTLDEPGKAKPGEPVSVFDLARRANLKEVLLIDEKIGGFFSAFRSAEKAHVTLCYGIKLVVCSNLADKTPESRATESKVIVMVTNTEAYSDLVRIWNRAWTTGHFSYRDDSYGRIDWAGLKELWTPRLMLGLPFFSSFLAVNTLSFSRVVPDLPPLTTFPLAVFREVDSRLPFAPLIKAAIDGYLPVARAEGVTIEEVSSKTVYYDRAADLRSYILRRAQQNRTTWDKPNVDHLSSDRFSMQSWEELVGAPVVGDPATVTPTS